LASVSPQSAEPARTGVVRPFPAVSDAALVTALREGRAEAGDQLFERYGEYVERLIVRVLGFDSEVPDLINEVFARAFERIDGLENAAALKPWLGSIACFTARSFLRDRRSRRRFLGFFAPEELPEVASAGAPVESSVALLRTYKVLDTLRPDDRIAFALRFVEGMSLPEIAVVMRLSIGTVKRRLTRGREHFLSVAKGDPFLRELIQKSQPWGEP
jgi:RNA polymerase sigma-70 factor, ECF subfamily